MAHLHVIGRILAVASLACVPLATLQADDFEDYQAHNPDPWEGFNRTVFSINDSLDRYTLKPVAKVYRKVTPEPVNTGISNVFSNLGEPKNLINNLLQGKPHDAGIDLSRFFFNTTFGLLGVFDVATRMGLQRNDEDLGQTLGSWGVDSGPYLVLPFLGPSTLRDGVARVPEAVIAYNYRDQVSHVPTRNTAIGVDLVDIRADLLRQERLIMGDRYVFVRNAWLQNREFKVRDGLVEDDF